MAKHTVTGYLYLYVPSLGYSKRSYSFSTTKLSHDDFVLTKEHTFDVEIPEDFDPVPAQIAALDEKERLLRLNLAMELMVLSERRSKLQALCYEAA